ncbi:Lrp/AsnC family transcriptional regulator [Haloarchaeobius baliensis]|uniref:Lrp/AsnC family transcriptional regulator n=1 Tax=Haloarchaeobius baliensis TaxID=1670458 RepID=UPI003F882E73
MTLQGIDELDRQILFALQRDGRETSSRDIAERMDVSPSTVRKRIDRLEDQGVITGYRAEVDFDRAGYQLQVQISCSAPVPEREALADAALEVDGVVSVREIASGEENVQVRVVATDNDDLTRIAGELSELGLSVSGELLIRRETFTPWAGFDERSEE